MSQDVTKDVLHLFWNTTLTIQQIADELDVSYKVVWKRIADNVSDEDRQERKRRNYRRSKLGSNNPMHGQYGEQHHNYKGVISDNKGYQLILKPDWYTGRKGSKHIFYHHYVYCLHNDLTEIPVGYDVHHIDGDPLNNQLNNLQLLTRAGHMKLHAELRKVQRLSERSREIVLPKRRAL